MSDKKSKPILTIKKPEVAKVIEPQRPRLYIVKDEQTPNGESLSTQCATIDRSDMRKRPMPPLLGMLHAFADAIETEVDTIKKL